MLIFSVHDLRDIVYELFGLFPAQARIGDGLTVYTAADFLAAVLDIALDHKSLHEVSYLRGKLHGV